MTEATPGNPQRQVITRDSEPNEPENTRVRLIAVRNRGNDARETTVPPKSRGLVIAIGKKGQLAVVFLHGSTASDLGYHVICEDWATRVIGKGNLKVILHGAIYNEAKIREKGRHVIQIARINPEDVKSLGDLSDVPTWEKDGKLNPKKYLLAPGFDIPNRLIKALNAERIEVVEAQPSASIYGLKNTTRSSR